MKSRDRNPRKRRSAGAAPPPRRDEAPVDTGPGIWERRGGWIIGALIVAHVAIYQTICTVKYRYYLYRDFDLAIFVQAVSQLRHGSWFSTVRGMNWLGDHTSLILVPLVPLFAVAPHPLTLLIVQTLALGLGAIPLYRLARRELPPGPLAVAVTALYLLHPALGYLNLFEFHPETLAVPLLLWCALELRAGPFGRTLLAAGVALLAREDVAFVILGYAGLAAVAVTPRRTKLGLALALMAVGSLALTFGVLHPMLLGGEATYGKMYAQWGDTPLAMLRHALTRPHEVVMALWNTPSNPADTLVKRQYWAQMFGPLLALPLLAPLWLLPAAPIVFEHMLSERTHQHAITYQYTALVLPVLCVAAVFGLKRAAQWLAPRPGVAAARAWAATLAMLLLAAGVLSQWLWGGVFGTDRWMAAPRNELIWPDSLERTLRPYRDRMMKRIPKDGAVLAGFEFLSHLATRPELHSLHHVVSGLYTYSNRPYPQPHHVSAIVGDWYSQIPYMDFGTGRRMRAVINESGLRPADAAGGVIQMLPHIADTVEFYTVGTPYDYPRLNLLADNQLLFLGALRQDSLVYPGDVVRIASYWKRVAPANRNYLCQVWLTQNREISLYSRARTLCYGMFLLPEWPFDTTVRETYHLLIPDDMPPGEYRPVFRLISEDSTGKQTLPIIQVGNIKEPMNLVGLGTVTVGRK